MLYRKNKTKCYKPTPSKRKVTVWVYVFFFLSPWESCHSRIFQQSPGSRRPRSSSAHCRGCLSLRWLPSQYGESHSRYTPAHMQRGKICFDVGTYKASDKKFMKCLLTCAQKRQQTHRGFTGPLYLVSDEGVQPDIGSLPDQLPHIVSIWLLDEIVEALTQQPVHRASVDWNSSWAQSKLPERLTSSTPPKGSCKQIKKKKKTFTVTFSTLQNEY